MAQTYATRQIGTDTLAIVQTASRGGYFDHPVVLRMVLLEGDTKFTRVDAKNVKRVISEEYHDGRCNGPKSRLGKAVAAMKATMESAHGLMALQAKLERDAA